MLRLFTSTDRSVRSWVFLVLLAPATLFLGGCATTGGGGGDFHSVAYAPTNPSKVHVVVSLNKQNVYVEEGDRFAHGHAHLHRQAGLSDPYRPFRRHQQGQDEAVFDLRLLGAGQRGPPRRFLSGASWRRLALCRLPHGLLGGIYARLRISRRPHLALPALARMPAYSRGRRRQAFRSWFTLALPVDVEVHPLEDARWGSNVPRPNDYADPDPRAFDHDCSRILRQASRHSAASVANLERPMKSALFYVGVAGALFTLINFARGRSAAGS